MELSGDAKILRIYIGEADRHEHCPLYEAIVREARRQGLAGATVVKGLMGFGKKSRIHTAKILRLSEDLPVIVEIVDTPEKIEAFLPLIDSMVDNGMVTLENLDVLLYRHSGGT
ncbi:DUF190 domain-containing protein [Marispirochaeta aestuarii]|uniref:DUF190 domain-containing protein n=1 Tax=Marispirochaeta aestuarii TaxID=1963862 RepID=UPI0029C8AAD5|nr:DUF190 domain-containing protein [Marispirochaeta aestuarii]